MTLVTIGALAFAGAACTIAAIIALSAPVYPAPVPTLQAAAGALVKNLGDLPKRQSFDAADGTPIAYRSYSGSPDRVAVLIHGSSGSSVLMHMIGRELGKAGITAYALDMRGHGFSGVKGDIAYIGQLEDDVAAFQRHIASAHSGARQILIGYSAGGGFILRYAGGPYGESFNGYVALAPYLGEDAPSARPRGEGGWVSAAMPRMIGLAILERIGIRQFGHLPVLAFAIPEEQRTNPVITPSYSFRLWSNFRSPRDWKKSIAGISRPTFVIAGAADELFFSERFEHSFRLVRDDIKVEIVPDTNHMQLVTADPAIAATVKTTAALLPARDR